MIISSIVIETTIIIQVSIIIEENGTGVNELSVVNDRSTIKISDSSDIINGGIKGQRTKIFNSQMRKMQ